MSPVLPQAVRTELDRLASAAAVCFAGLPSGAALAAIALLCQRIAEETSELHEAARAHGDPISHPGTRASAAPHLPESLKPVPVPPDVVEEAVRTFDENEVTEAVREIRASGGRKLEDFLPELERAAAGPERHPNA